MKLKPRDQYIYIGCEEKFDRVDTAGDSFILPDDGKTYYTFHQREYARTKKPKVIYALFRFFGSREIKLDPDNELKRYDRLYAIDTNYKDIAVSTAFEGMWLPGKAGVTIRRIGTRSFVPSSLEREREAWGYFVQNHDAEPTQKCCLFVDSDLGKLISINKREIPVIGDFFLPDNWQLNYATSDANDDFVAVRMMNMCEKANKRFREGA